MESMVPQLSDLKKDVEKSIVPPLNPGPLEPLNPRRMPCSALLHALADLVFPPKCIQCGVLLQTAGDLALCPACLSRITFIRSPLCSCCGAPFDSRIGDDHLCGSCIASEPPFVAARSAGVYDEVLLEVVHRFKYNRHWPSGKVLERLMIRHIWQDVDPNRYDLVLPVPLHPRKLRQRGFNQSVILGRALAGHHRVPLRVDLLRRTGYTLPQVGLDAKDRHKNVKGAFDVRRREEIEGRRILLVDDVYTTGSTVGECARVLREAGASEVVVLTLARAI